MSLLKEESAGDLSITSGVCESVEEQIVVQPMQTIAERTENSDDPARDSNEQLSATKRLL
jgi:hypothetical protein